MSKTKLALVLAIVAGLGGPSIAQEAPMQAAATTEDGVEVQQFGDEFYCKQRRLGQWFYCERPKAKPDDKAAPAPAPAEPAAARLKKITAQLEELKAQAILEPSPENVSAYITYQREQLDRASTFADVWRRAIWQNPELDYTLQRPVSTLAKQTYMDQRKGDLQRVMASIGQRYGVFYFYSASCAACDAFSPVMRMVADQYGLTVMAVSMDGGPSQHFPRALVNTGQYEAMGLTGGGQVPALVLFDTVTKRPVPIGYGVMAADEVVERIYALTTVQTGSDF